MNDGGMKWREGNFLEKGTCLASCQSMSNAERQRGQAMPVLRTGWPNSRSPVRVGACCPAERRIGPVAGPWHCLPAEPELGLLFSSGQDDRPKRSAEGRQHPTLRPVGRTSCGRPLHRRSSRHRESRPGETHEGGPHAKHIRTSLRLLSTTTLKCPQVSRDLWR